MAFTTNTVQKSTGKGTTVLTQALFWTAAGTGFTCLMTALGAAAVFLLRGRTAPTLHRLMLGFAAGVMLASSVWSLLIPAIEYAAQAGLPGWLPAAAGCACGVLFLLWADRLICSLHSGSPSRRRAGMLAFAVSIHNIPEGMAVGVSFALAVQGDSAAWGSAAALAFGVGLQNFPEGAAISLPLRQEGVPPRRAFTAGALSGVAEPVAGLLTVFAAGTAHSLLPWLLSFAAGSMLYVVAQELIPQACGQEGTQCHTGTLGVMAGFLVMMILDVALG